jgi:flagellar biosynthesis/type III secretory pathway M-ring protein FliF/YscJ
MLARLVAWAARLVPWQVWALAAMLLMLSAAAWLWRLDAAAYARGHATALAEVAAETHKMQAALFRAADALSIRSAAIEAERTAVDQRQEAFANAARHDPNVAARVPDPRDLRALAAEWAGPAH